jgi:hypothetical protein
MNCEQVEELLSAYLDNELAPEERRRVAAHLQGCSHCSGILADFRRHDFLLSQLPRVTPDPALHTRIFSSPEYLELTGTFDVVHAEAPPHRHPRLDAPGRPHLIALPGGRSPSRGGLLSGMQEQEPKSQPTRKRPAVRSQRGGSWVLRAMYVAIAATILLTIGVGGYISWNLTHPAQQTVGGTLPPPASLQSGPLAAGMHIVFLRDGRLMSIPADGNTTAVALTPANVTVAANWAISAPLPGRSAGNLLAYIDLQTATVHIIRSDGQSDKVLPLRLLKAGVPPASVWDTGTGAAILGSLAWSPASDTSMLAFVADPTGTGLTNLYIYSTGTGSVQMVSLPLKGSVSHPVWSPDGVRVAFAFTHNGVTSILDYNTQNHGLLTITNGSQQAGASILSFDWSPDTDIPAITWSVGVSGHVQSVWTRRVGVSSNVAPRLLAQGNYTQALYSRNGHGGVGSWLLVGSPSGRTADLWRADLTGVSPVQLTSGKQISYAQWSPDGMKADYLNAVTSGVGTLYVVNMATAGDTQIATGVAGQPAPIWSFDSQQLAYSTGTQTMVVNVQAGQKPFALNLHGPVSIFIWSAASSHQLVVALGDGQQGIFLVDTQHNTTKQVDKTGTNGPMTWSQVP